MLAIRAREFGPSDGLRQEEVPAPELLPSEILTRVVASGVNPIEWKIRGGAMGRALGRPLPVTFGWECAGVVTAIGGDVHDFRVGDAVCAMLEFGHEGTHAQMVAIPAEQAALKPKTLEFAEAAALPMTGQAAWSALEAAEAKAGVASSSMARRAPSATGSCSSPRPPASRSWRRRRPIGACRCKLSVPTTYSTIGRSASRMRENSRPCSTSSVAKRWNARGRCSKREGA